MPHGGEEHHNAGLVRPDFGGLAVGLDHQYGILCRVEVGQCRAIHAELITQHEN